MATTFISSKRFDGLSIEEEVAQSENAVILHISGTVDSHTYDQLEEKFQSLFSNGMYRIVVDMERVQYISSAGIGVFVGAMSQASTEKGALILTGLSTVVREVFEVLGIAPMFTITVDKSSALAAFNP